MVLGVDSVIPPKDRGSLPHSLSDGWCKIACNVDHRWLRHPMNRREGGVKQTGQPVMGKKRIGDGHKPHS